MKPQRPGGQLRRLGQREQHVARAHDDEREHAEAELLGAAPAADDAHVEGTVGAGIVVVVVVVVVVVLVAAVARASTRPTNAIAAPLSSNSLRSCDVELRVLGQVGLRELGVPDDRRVPDQQAAGPALVHGDLTRAGRTST